MRIDTADGQHQLHGTAMALYQKETGLPADNSTQIINRSSRLEKRQSATPFYESQFCPEPKRENVKYNSYTEFVTHDYFEQLKKKDLIWSLLKSKLDMSLQVPTWAAYNSLKLSYQWICNFMPNVYNFSPEKRLVTILYFVLWNFTPYLQC